jgi:hypothetical protein
MMQKALGQPAQSTLVPRDISRRQHPTVLRPFLPEVQRIIEFTHRDVLNEVQKLANLFRLALLSFPHDR